MTEPIDDSTLLRAALHGLSLPICVLDARGVVRLANPAWAEHAPGAAGYDGAASFNYLKSLEHLAAQGEVHARLLHDGIASVLAGSAPQFRLEHPLNAERTKWQLVHVDVLSGVGALLVHTDVTARRTAESRLRRATTRYRAVGVAAGVALWEIDLAQKSVSVDAILCNLLGYPTAQPQRWADWHARVHAEDVALVDAVWQASCQDRPRGTGEERTEIGPMDVRLVDAHGGYRCFECRGVVVRDRRGHAVRAQGSMQDVSSRRAAQDALHRSNAHLQELARRLVAAEARAREQPGG